MLSAHDVDRLRQGPLHRQLSGLHLPTGVASALVSQRETDRAHHRRTVAATPNRLRG